MFNSKTFSQKIGPLLQQLCAVVILLSLASCMPTTPAPSVNSNNSTDDAGTGTATSNYEEPTYPMDGIFLQESGAQSNSNVTLPVNFSDSFLIRGKTLSQYLRKLPLSTNFCLVGKFNYISGSDRFLVLSAKGKSYTDLVNKTTEYYLQVEPSNDQANQNDCLTYNLSNTLFTGATSPSLHFGLQQLCASCSTSVISNPLKLYFINGEEVSTLSMSAMTMTISGSTATTANSCVDSSACKARGYDCCLESQCVKDAAIRPSAMTSSGFTSAQEDVRLNPSRFVLYPQFYYVCNSNPGTDGSSTGSTTDPEYEASVRLQEMTHLYQCLNKVDGEFSYCTVKFSEASKRIPGDFSAESLGYKDDINFTTLNPNYTNDYKNNIVKIVYGGTTLYEQNKTALTDASFVSNTVNDDLSEAQAVHVTATLPSNANDDNLYLTYKVDGTCEKISTTLARCTKTYVQGSSDTYSTTWHNSSKTFYLPTYADISSLSTVVVKVSGMTVPEDATTWYRPGTSINFAYPIYTNQTVEIQYFVNTGASDLLKMKEAAQSQVNTMCSCGSSLKCNLKPSYNTSNSLVSYECVYPAATADSVPVNQTVYVSNKNVPHRYFDTNGVNYDEDYQSAPDQELTAFSYTNNAILKPTNKDTYIGFNEIYGSFAKSGTYVARPARSVKVKKDKLYDLIVDSGVFSTCSTCGSDYYSSLQKIFPQNFSGKGGGYSPDYLTSIRENSTSVYRSDDLLYGRACFVPATMIPWTHITSTSPTDQRRSRLAAQHFLYANGYNRDWYGFDYGSLIGSFDGVKWFSIGNQRRIKAATSKLYLAVNAYFGDLSIDSNFKVSIMESSIYSSPIAEHDTASDGAECQKAHYCSNDNDCFTQLGYDYTCQNISGLTTNWPQFDATGAEVVGSVTKSIASIVGGANGQSKRCIYRGRGAPCLNNLDDATGTTFNGSSLLGTLACSPNNSCLATTSNHFNDRIARFANTPTAQNSAGVVSSGDTVGLGAKIIGRPYDYYGSKSVLASTKSALTSNDVSAVCVPGKDISGSTHNYDLNSRHPSSRTETSDKIFGVGATMNSTSSKYLNACPATDTVGVSLQQYDADLGDETLSSYTNTQNLSSNLLNLTPLTALNIFSSLSGSQVTKVGYQRNTCLRAPGASCFSDMECAPSSFIASKVKSASVSSVMNEAEEKYWEEELICGNSDFKYISAGVVNPSFSVKKNVCCRDMGKTITVYTETDDSDWKWCDGGTNIKMAGVNTDISSINRYSRVHTGFDKMTCDRSDTSKPFALSVAAGNTTARLTQILKQYTTLDAINQRTCCTKNWVRSFASENGGGHDFSKSKMQTVDKTMFERVSWFADDETLGVGDPAFECNISHYADSSCEVRTLTPADEEKYLTWAGTLELIGIPQVAVKTNDQIYQLVDANQADNSTLYEPLANSIKKWTEVGEDFTDSDLNKYYSAASYDKFEMDTGGLKKVFSENEFNCCIPSGQEVPSTTTKGQCCTGYLANINGPPRCCLPDFTNVTVYLNRYVSSEGRGLPDNAYDEKTGFIKDSGQVQLMAAQKNLCCSGRTMTGVAISSLSIPVEGGKPLAKSQLTISRRFNYRTDAIDNNTDTLSIGSWFDTGLRWNNHVYCLPADANLGN